MLDRIVVLIHALYNARSQSNIVLTVALTCLFIEPAIADDTEIFFNADSIPPNVLFIVDVSGSMDWTDSTPLPDIPDNVLWLDAADRGTMFDAEGDSAYSNSNFSGYVSTLRDKSGNDNHLTGTTTTLGNINGRTTVRFTNNNRMTGPDIFGGSLTEGTIFLVQQENVRSNNFFLNFNGDTTNGNGRVSFHTPWGNKNWYWDAGNAWSNRTFISDPAEVGEVTQLTAYKTIAGNENGFSLNSGAISASKSGATSAATTGGMHFGRGINDHELGELIVYDRKLTDDEISSVQQYLDKKWRTRLERTKVALNSLLSENNGFNAGLMTYSSDAQGQFSLRDEIKPVAESKDSLLTHINALYANGGTPTQSAMFEGMRYFRGESPMAMGGIMSSGPPPLVQCQGNHIVLITDGVPYGGPSWPSIGSQIGSDCANNQGNNRLNGNCGIELAGYMNDNDHYPNVRGVNNIFTHTIGLSLDMPWLGDMAAAGGGIYYSVGTSGQLLSAFESIMDSAFDQSTTFVPPSITVDQFTRLSHRDDAYLALFEPTTSMRWPGNLKRYSFSGSPAAIRDMNNTKVLDSGTGTFTDDSHSFWSAEADGAAINRGGAANKLDHTNRTLATYTGDGTKYLTDTKNRVHENNSDSLGNWIDADGDELTNLLAWARGVDVDDEDIDGSTTDTRNALGDPLHSNPAIVTYGGTSSDPDSLVFVGTNEGYLHAFNSRDGTEQYSFIPPELLSNLKIFYEDSAGRVRPYGLDGDLTVWVDDINNNGIVDTSSEHAYLYAGMRRGGKNYYALDVTEKSDPEYLWTIQGGIGDFAELGQSWSKLTKSKIKLNDQTKDVLIFGGGYDPAQDYSTIRSADTIGNTLFIIDAEDGSLIWKTSMDSKSDYSKMIYSMPSDPRLLDIDGDDIVDQMYIGDMGGQIWRFDFNPDASTASELITGGLIAELADLEEENNRRFFYPPDVSLVSHNNVNYLSLAIGSGNRAHPLGRTVDNRFFMIRQEHPYSTPDGYGMVDTPGTNSQPATYRPITEADLYGATANDIESSDTEIALDAKAALEDASGWFVKLEENGEKVLGSSVTIDHNIIFATYIPDTEGQTDDVCKPASGSNRAYLVSLYDASPAVGSVRHQNIEQPGIVGTVSVNISDEGSDVSDDNFAINAVIGLESIEIPSVDLTRRVYWSEYPDF